MKCPKCGYENAEDVLYCGLCYNLLKEKPVSDNYSFQANSEGLENSYLEEYTKKFKSTWVYYHLFFVVFMIVVVSVGIKKGNHSFWPYLAANPFEAVFFAITIIGWVGCSFYMNNILKCPKCDFEIFTIYLQKIRFWKLLFTNNCPNCKVKLLNLDGFWKILKWMPPW